MKYYLYVIAVTDKPGNLTNRKTSVIIVEPVEWIITDSCFDSTYLFQIVSVTKS